MQQLCTNQKYTTLSRALLHLQVIKIIYSCNYLYTFYDTTWIMYFLIFSHVHMNIWLFSALFGNLKNLLQAPLPTTSICAYLQLFFICPQTNSFGKYQQITALCNFKDTINIFLNSYGQVTIYNMIPMCYFINQCLWTAPKNYIGLLHVTYHDLICNKKKL